MYTRRVGKMIFYKNNISKVENVSIKGKKPFLIIMYTSFAYQSQKEARNFGPNVENPLKEIKMHYGRHEYASSYKFS